MKLKLLILALLTTLNLEAITVGEIPKNVIIQGNNGGLVKDNTPHRGEFIK